MGPPFHPVVTDQSPYPAVKAAAYFAAGIKRTFQRRAAEGVEDLRETARQQAHDWKVHFGLAFALRKTGAKSESVAETKLALKFVPPGDDEMLRKRLRAGRMPDGSGRITIVTTDKQGHTHIRFGRDNHP